MKRAMIAAFAIAAAFGVYLASVAGWPVVAIGLASIASGIAYTGGPWPLGYHGLGDVFVLVFFGFVAVCGTAYVQLAAVPGLAVWAAVPVGALATAILVVNNLRDRATDVRAGKRTLAVRLGRTGALVEYAVLLAASYAVRDRTRGRPAATPGWCCHSRRCRSPRCASARSSVAVTGAEFNACLAATGKLLLAYGVLFAAGLCAVVRITACRNPHGALAGRAPRRGSRARARARGGDRRRARRRRRHGARRGCPAARDVDRHGSAMPRPRSPRSRPRCRRDRRARRRDEHGGADHRGPGGAVRDRDRAGVARSAQHARTRIAALLVGEPARRAAPRDRRRRRRRGARAAVARGRALPEDQGRGSPATRACASRPPCPGVRLRVDANRGWPRRRGRAAGSRTRRAPDRLRRGAVRRRARAAREDPALPARARREPRHARARGARARARVAAARRARSSSRRCSVASRAASSSRRARAATASRRSSRTRSRARSARPRAPRSHTRSAPTSRSGSGRTPRSTTSGRPRERAVDRRRRPRDRRPGRDHHARSDVDVRRVRHRRRRCEPRSPRARGPERRDDLRDLRGARARHAARARPRQAARRSDRAPARDARRRAASRRHRVRAVHVRDDRDLARRGAVARCDRRRRAHERGHGSAGATTIAGCSRCRSRTPAGCRSSCAA